MSSILFSLGPDIARIGIQNVGNQQMEVEDLEELTAEEEEQDQATRLVVYNQRKPPKNSIGTIPVEPRTQGEITGMRYLKIRQRTITVDQTLRGGRYTKYLAQL